VLIILRYLSLPDCSINCNQAGSIESPPAVQRWLQTAGVSGIALLAVRAIEELEK
jgi:hypothetical protein